MKIKKYKSLIVGSLLAAAIIVTPVASFAKDNNSDKARDSNSNNSLLGRIESFFSAPKANAATNTTPNISGITAPTVLQAGATGTWMVKASDPQNGTLSYAVDWGDTGGIRPLAMLSMPAFVQTSTFTHAYATAGTYTIKFTVSNATGQETTSTVTVHVMGAAVAAPVISNVQAVSTKPRHATITWTTDVKSSSLVWDSTTTPVDTTAAANVSRTGNVTSHSITLNKLTPGTTYYVVVGSADTAGTTMSSPEVSFTTPAVVNKNAPTISSLTGADTVAAGATETVTVNASDPKNGNLTYSADWGDNATGMMAMLAKPAPVFTQSASFDHVYNTAGTYTATFTVKNDAGLTDSSTLQITVTPAVVTPPPTDTTAPVMSNVQILVGSASATVTWNTDEAANSKVFYSTTTPVDVTDANTANVSDASLGTAHSLTISSLTPSTLYHFVIQSADASANVKTSSELEFMTTMN